MSGFIRYIVALVLALGAFVAAPARAGTLEEMQKRGSLMWGADQQGGGPHRR